VRLDFSRPGRPSDNAIRESFNNRVRQELLNPNWFRSLAGARVQAAAWRADYNANHHSSLGNLPPEKYARRAKNVTQRVAISRRVVEHWGYDKLMAALRETLSADEIAELGTEGAAWSEDQAVEEALR
jgi:hypothetical protein